MTEQDRAEDAAADPESGRRRSAGVSTAVGVVLGGAAMFFVVRTLVREWSDAAEEIRDAQVSWLLGGLALAAAGMTSIGLAWRHVLRTLGVRALWSRVLAWYFVGEIGKYLPGGVWPVLGRGELARSGGVPRSRAYASVGMSLAILYLTAMFVCTAFLPFAVAGSGASPWMLFLLALPVGVILLHHDVLGWMLDRIAALTKREIDVEIPQWRDSLSLIAHYVPSWLFIGTATYAVARALTPDVSYPQLMFATVLSWTAGFLAVPVPAGAGIREAVLLASSGLEGSIAVTTAIVARVLFIIVDAGGAAIGAPFATRRRGGVSVGPLHPGDRSEAGEAVE